MRQSKLESLTSVVLKNYVREMRFISVHHIRDLSLHPLILWILGIVEQNMLVGMSSVRRGLPSKDKQEAE